MGVPFDWVVDGNARAQGFLAQTKQAEDIPPMPSIYRKTFASVDDAPFPPALCRYALRHLRLKYEDLATSPELAANLIYVWSGIRPIPPSVLNWIDHNTKLPGCEHGTRHLATDAENVGNSAFAEPDGSEGGVPAVSTANATFNVGPDEHDDGPRTVLCSQNTRMERRRYGTKRDFATIVSMWRTQMPKDEAMAVWEACEASGVMREFGYDL